MRKQWLFFYRLVNWNIGMFSRKEFYLFCFLVTRYLTRCYDFTMKLNFVLFTGSFTIEGRMITNWKAIRNKMTNRSFLPSTNFSQLDCPVFTEQDLHLINQFHIWIEGVTQTCVAIPGFLGKQAIEIIILWYRVVFD